jgi:hypothetical protein
MRRLAGVVTGLMLAAVGCGGGGGTTFACLLGTGTDQQCIETTTSTSGTPDCGAAVRVDSCAHAGVDGACRHSFSAGGASLSQTIWYYSGTPAGTSQEMSDCMDNGGTWLTP